MSATTRILKTFMETQPNNGVTATIVGHTTINSNLEKVMVRFNKKGTKDNYRTAMAKVLSDRATPVMGSFRSVAGASLTSIGIISNNPTIVPYDTVAHASYKAITANCLMADDESLWDVVDTDAGKVLVRQAEEDLSDLVAMASVRDVSVPTMSTIANVGAQAQEFVTYVHPVTHTLRHGFVVQSNEADPIVVIPVEDTEEEDIIPTEDLIVESRFLPTTAFEGIAAVPERLNKERLKEYYQQVYEYSPEYLQEFLDVIDNNSVL